MPWEHRDRGDRYYTRSFKTDGVVTRQYIGAGPLAEQAARADDATRQALVACREARRRQRAQARDLDRQLDDLCRLTDHLIRIELTAAGYHQHARGAWRKWRKSRATPSSPIPPPAAHATH